MRLIYADKLRKDVLDLPNCYNGFSDTYDKAMILDLVDEQPTVDAEPIRRGGWIWEREPAAYRCSRCNYRVYGCTLEIMEGDFKYCPSCGAKMDQEQEGEQWAD